MKEAGGKHAGRGNKQRHWEMLMIFQQVGWSSKGEKGRAGDEITKLVVGRRRIEEGIGGP